MRSCAMAWLMTLSAASAPENDCAATGDNANGAQNNIFIVTIVSRLVDGLGIQRRIFAPRRDLHHRLPLGNGLRNSTLCSAPFSTPTQTRRGIRPRDEIEEAEVAARIRKKAAKPVRPILLILIGDERDVRRYRPACRPRL